MTTFALSAAAAAAVLGQDVADCGLNERAAEWLQAVGHAPDALPVAVGFAPDVGRCPITGLRHVPGLVIRITLTEVGEQGGKAMTFDSRAAPARLDALIVRLKRQHELISVVFNINSATMYRFYGFTIVAEKVGSFYRLGLTID